MSTPLPTDHPQGTSEEIRVIAYDFASVHWEAVSAVGINALYSGGPLMMVASLQRQAWNLG